MIPIEKSKKMYSGIQIISEMENSKYFNLLNLF